MMGTIKSIPPIKHIGQCIYCDSIGVCNKKPKIGLFRQKCKVPCKIGQSRRPPPPPPPSTRKVYC